MAPRSKKIVSSENVPTYSVDVVEEKKVEEKKVEEEKVDEEEKKQGIDSIKRWQDHQNRLQIQQKLYQQMIQEKNRNRFGFYKKRSSAPILQSEPKIYSHNVYHSKENNSKESKKPVKDLVAEKKSIKAASIRDVLPIYLHKLDLESKKSISTTSNERSLLPSDDQNKYFYSYFVAEFKDGIVKLLPIVVKMNKYYNFKCENKDKDRDYFQQMFFTNVRDRIHKLPLNDDAEDANDEEYDRYESKRSTLDHLLFDKSYLKSVVQDYSLIDMIYMEHNADKIFLKKSLREIFDHHTNSFYFNMIDPEYLQEFYEFYIALYGAENIVNMQFLWDLEKDGEGAGSEETMANFTKCVGFMKPYHKDRNDFEQSSTFGFMNLDKYLYSQNEIQDLKDMFPYKLENCLQYSFNNHHSFDNIIEMFTIFQCASKNKSIILEMFGDTPVSKKDQIHKERVLQHPSYPRMLHIFNPDIIYKYIVATKNKRTISNYVDDKYAIENSQQIQFVKSLTQDQLQMFYFQYSSVSFFTFQYSSVPFFTQEMHGNGAFIKHLYNVIQKFEIQDGKKININSMIHLFIEKFIEDQSALIEIQQDIKRKNIVENIFRNEVVDEYFVYKREMKRREHTLPTFFQMLAHKKNDADSDVDPSVFDLLSKEEIQGKEAKEIKESSDNKEESNDTKEKMKRFVEIAFSQLNEMMNIYFRDVYFLHKLSPDLVENIDLKNVHFLEMASQVPHHNIEPCNYHFQRDKDTNTNFVSNLFSNLFSNLYSEIMNYKYQFYSNFFYKIFDVLEEKMMQNPQINNDDEIVEFIVKSVLEKYIDHYFTHNKKYNISDLIQEEKTNASAHKCKYDQTHLYVNHLFHFASKSVSLKIHKDIAQNIQVYEKSKTLHEDEKEFQLSVFMNKCKDGNDGFGSLLTNNDNFNDSNDSNDSNDVEPLGYNDILYNTKFACIDTSQIDKDGKIIMSEYNSNNHMYANVKKNFKKNFKKNDRAHNLSHQELLNMNIKTRVYKELNEPKDTIESESESESDKEEPYTIFIFYNKVTKSCNVFKYNLQQNSENIINKIIFDFFDVWFGNEFIFIQNLNSKEIIVSFDDIYNDFAINTFINRNEVLLRYEQCSKKYFSQKEVVPEALGPLKEVQLTIDQYCTIIRKYYNIDNNIDNRVRSTELSLAMIEKINRDLESTREYVDEEHFISRFIEITSKLGLCKKRYSAGNYYYGISEKIDYQQDASKNLVCSFLNIKSDNCKVDPIKYNEDVYRFLDIMESQLNQFKNILSKDITNEMVVTSKALRNTTPDKNMIVKPF